MFKVGDKVLVTSHECGGPTGCMDIEVPAQVRSTFVDSNGGLAYVIEEIFELQAKKARKDFVPPPLPERIEPILYVVRPREVRAAP